MQRAAKGSLARRLLAGRVPALMAALVVICLAGVLLTLGRGSGVTIERSDGGEAAAGQEADASEGSEAAETEASVLVVHVDGCVASPGVYELAGPDLRVNDAVEAADRRCSSQRGRRRARPPLRQGEVSPRRRTRARS